MELEALLKDKEDLIASFAGGSVSLQQSLISSSLATSHAPSLVVSVPASRPNAPGATGYVHPSIPSDSLSLSGVFEGFIGGIPMDLGKTTYGYAILEPRLDIIVGILWPKWPQHLPRPDLLRYM